jgi:hypothetical protein
MRAMIADRAVNAKIDADAPLNLRALIQISGDHVGAAAVP